MVWMFLVIVTLLSAPVDARTLLALAPDAFSSTLSNVSIILGTPQLLSSYTDGIGGGAYAGWSYPNVVRGNLSSGGEGFLMLYSACTCSNASNCAWGPGMYTFLAESTDGVSWEPVIVPTAPPGAPPGALFSSGEVGVCVDDAGGVGVGPGERYKILRTDTTIQVSDDGQNWTQWRYNWTSTGVDPGFHALRATRGGAAVIVTARPQALRPQGRHAGAIFSAEGWGGLGSQMATPTQPLDSALYRFTTQIYGLPAFDYAAVLAAGGGGGGGLPPPLIEGDEGGNYIGFPWRLLAPNGESGVLPSTLAFSRDALSWIPAPQSTLPLVEQLANDTLLPGNTYNTINGTWPSPSIGAAACNTACCADSTSCVAWSYFTPNAGLGAERCELKRDLSAPQTVVGVVSGFNSDLAAEGSSPLAATAEFFSLPLQPSSVAHRQFYPKTILAVGGRLLIYASVSSTVHGDVAPNASAIQVFSLRPDGFAAAVGPPSGAAATSAVTAPLDWGMGEAALNVLCGAAGGGVRVAVLQGTLPLNGYSLADADPAPGDCDELAWVPSWGGGARGLSALASITIQLQVELSAGAQLFAIRGNFSAWGL